MDFTLKMYKQLLSALQNAGYKFVTFEEYCDLSPKGKFVILRHDIDRMPKKAMEIAKIDCYYKARSTFFFQSKTFINQRLLIEQIVKCNHEIGYHYDDLVQANGTVKKAINSFSSNLTHFRQFYPVRTVCMHGSPASKYDNHDLWKHYNYRDFGIIGEPYFDVDFEDVFYLTDTGRCWDGDKYSVRDKVKSSFTQSYHSTNDIIRAAQNGTLPPRIMITTHPQRWTDNPVEWLIEWVMQNLKNVVKRWVMR